MLILKPWNMVLIMFMIIGLLRSGMSPGAGVGALSVLPAPGLIDEVDASASTSRRCASA